MKTGRNDPCPAAAGKNIKNRIVKPGGNLIFCEHGIAPDDIILKWQNRMNPIWKKVSGGCNLNRPIPHLIKKSSFKIKHLDMAYMSSFKLASFNYWGTAKGSLKN